MNHLVITNLNKMYGKKQALNNVNLTFDSGIYGILGPNGAGKTTLFRAITGIDVYSKGTIQYGKVDAKDKLYATNIAYLPQHFSGFSDLSVQEMLEYMAILKNMEKKVIKDKIENVLMQMNLQNVREKKISKLSGGMLRRVGIAQAIMGEEPVLVLDEPTVGLDPEERVHFRVVLSEVAKNRIVLISSHIVSDLESICQKLIIINEGNVIKQATITDILELTKGKVYKLLQSQIKSIRGEYTIVGEENDGSQKQVRIIAKELQTFESVDATLEEGYLCVIKGY